MKIVILLVALLATTVVFGQCPFPANLTSSGICPGGILTVSATNNNNISKIEWIRDGNTVNTVTSTASYNPVAITVAGGNGGGLGNNQLDHPQGIYVDASGNVIIADQNNNRIQAWTTGATFGNTIASSFGVGTNQLVSPVDVLPDNYGNLYITNYTDNRIEKWTFPNTSGVIVAGGNGFGNAPDQFDYPVGIFLGPNGTLYVADLDNHRVQRFVLGSTVGVTVAGGNGAGSAANQLQFPTAVFVDEAGNVFVVDDGNHRIQKWAPGAASGVTVAGGNGPGAAANQLQYPYGIYVDGFGNIFVADATNNRIQEWTPGATSGITVAGGNGLGSGANQLNDPRSVWMDANGNLYVSDNLNFRVQKFALQTNINNNYTTPSPGVYTAVVTFTTGCTESSNPVTIEGFANPSITITASANPINICTNVTFTAVTTHAGSNPAFQWKINGANAGANQPTFQTGVLQNSDVVSCVLIPNDACISNSPLSSNAIAIGVNGLPQATMISKNAFCPGDTLAITSADSLSKIVWSETGTPVKTVTANPVGTCITVAGGNGQGINNNQLFLPTGIFVDAQGNMYIADQSNNRIMKWAPGASSGTPVITQQLNAPSSVAVDAAGNIYVSDNVASVEKFPPGFGSLGTVVAGANGIGSNANQLNTPGFLFLDDAGNLYIADANNYRIQKWAPGATSGVTVAGGNGVGLANNQIVPTSFFVDKAGNIFIADAYNDRVVEWAPGATSGVEILGPSDINFGPRGIWVDANGNLYLTSIVDNSVKKFAPGSKTGVTIAGGNGAGNGADQFNWPQSISMDAQGNLYVPDFFNNRVQKILQHPTIDTIYKAVMPGSYTAEVTTSGGCMLGTSTIIVKPNVSPAVSVLASASQVCAGMPVTFTATPSNGGTSPLYSWQVNGTDAGVSGPSFTTTAGNGVSSTVCKMIGNADCALQPSATSSPVAITVNSVVTPSINIQTTSLEICSGATATFNASFANGGSDPLFQWTVNGNPSGQNSTQFSSNNLNDGDVVACQITSNAACSTSPKAQSNTISMRVLSAVPPVVNISADPNPACSGQPVSFLAQITNAGASPQYQWQINGINAGGAGSNGDAYTTTNLNNGDAVSCLVSTGACGAGTSNTIVMEINPTPVIEPNQLFNSTTNGVTLMPKVIGDIVTWNWSPGDSLSGVDIANPVANPQSTTKYILTVVSGEGCTAKGEIIVKVYSDIYIPNAFSPNADGTNDVFYVSGGPHGSTIKNFSIFNRWGQIVFEVHNALPGDAAFGWNGSFRGMPALVGNYVYLITVTLAGGEQQIYNGTVLLLR
jgi:gliding motility-associated-like protein